MYSGAEEAFIPMVHPEVPPFHGVDGFGDMQWETDPNLSALQNETATNAMHRLVAKVLSNYFFKVNCKLPLTYYSSTRKKSH